MNSSDFHEKSAGYLIGKEFVIVMVVIFSALSFTLGFFVGKSRPRDQEQSITALPPREQAPPPAPAVGSAAPQPEPAAAPQPQQTKADEIVIEQPAQAVSQAKSPAQKPAAQPVSQASPKKEHPAAEKAPVQQELYAVQLAAFKNLAEAKNFKAKYEKRGVKSYIVTVQPKGKEKIYKVKSGEFRKKSDAELLAVKLKKTEGLHPFVTLKAE